jgi:hypothetical protein
MRHLCTILALATSIVFAIACGGSSSQIGTLRFKNQEPITKVNDRADVAKKPREIVYNKILYHLDGQAHKRLTRWMQFRDIFRSRGVNSLDEVPDSTWFTNRIGVREMSAEEVGEGPNVTGSPEDFKPWTITRSKTGGTAIGFFIRDTRGIKYLLKFDQPRIPEMETGADVIVAKLLWAAGYNVPEDYVVKLKRSDLIVAKDAVLKDPLGNKTPLTAKFVDERLKLVESNPGGTIRGLTSQLISGVPVGGWPREGTREDDPNDRIAHGERRDLRGMYALFSWLDHTDMKEDNTLDSWQVDADDPDRHYLVHYLLDFGLALGVQGWRSNGIHYGYNYSVDPGSSLASFLTLGIWQRPWEGRTVPDIPGVGLFGHRNYRPGKWKPFAASYYPFLDVDRFDNFWAAKILIRFTREQLRAVIQHARYTDPRAGQYILEVLLKRQRKAARHFFRQVDPLDHFTVTASQGGSELCFEDLAIHYRLEDAPTSYEASGYNYEGVGNQWRAYATPDAAGRACLSALPIENAMDGYTMIKIQTKRSGLNGRGTVVHLAKGPKGTLRVIGLRRL